MKRITVLLLAAALCLGVAACGNEASTYGAGEAEKMEEPAQQKMELAGPWHLDGEKNALSAFRGRFPGYAERGAWMELGSNGQMSWYIGAEGWHGTYVVDGETLHAQLISDLSLSQQLWDFRIVTENETAVLEMPYQDMTVSWAYGDREETDP